MTISASPALRRYRERRLQRRQRLGEEKRTICGERGELGLEYVDLEIPMGMKNGRRTHQKGVGIWNMVEMNELAQVGHAESKAGVEDRTWRTPAAEGMQSRNPGEERELRAVGGNGESIMGPVFTWAGITNTTDQGAQTTDIYLS